MIFSARWCTRESLKYKYSRCSPGTSLSHLHLVFSPLPRVKEWGCTASSMHWKEAASLPSRGLYSILKLRKENLNADLCHGSAFCSSLVTERCESRSARMLKSINSYSLTWVMMSDLGPYWVITPPFPYFIHKISWNKRGNYANKFNIRSKLGNE